VNLGIAHPVPLAMQDVGTDLHILEDLRHGEPRGAHQPGGRKEGEEQNSAELALHVDELADVCGVLGAGGARDLLAQGVELARQRLDVRGGEVCGRVRKHSTHHQRRRDAEERRTSQLKLGRQTKGPPRRHHLRRTNAGSYQNCYGLQIILGRCGSSPHRTDGNPQVCYCSGSVGRPCCGSGRPTFGSMMAAERPCSIQPPSGRNGHTKGNAPRGEQGLVNQQCRLSR